MGIKDFNPTLKKRASDAYFKVSALNFSGYRIAIDAPIWIHKNLSTAKASALQNLDSSCVLDENLVRRNLYDALFSFIINWLARGVTPIFVFDGKHDSAKKKTHEERRAKAQKELQLVADAYRSLGFNVVIGERGIDIPAPSAAADPLALLSARNSSDFKNLKQTIINCSYIGGINYNEVYDMLKTLGIPTIRAIGDGERLCAALCREGKVAAVYTTDTDTLVHGAPLIITGFSSYGDSPKVDCVRLDKILQGLQLQYPNFVEWAIMCGCDYNEHIKGVGPISALKHIKTYGFIHNIPKEIINDVSCLNAETCRTLFQPLYAKQLCTEFTTTIELPPISDFITYLKSLSLDIAYNTIESIYTAVGYMQPTNDGTITRDDPIINPFVVAKPSFVIV